MSRGQTRRTSTTTEAESYLRLALSSGLLSDNPNHVLRATTENYALDSYQNLLFSVARFHEYTGHYPRYITIIGYEMKRRRFEELHRAALRWPRSNFDYLGIDAEGEEAIGAIEREVKHITLLFTSQPNSIFSRNEMAIYPIPATRMDAMVSYNQNVAQETHSCDTIHIIHRHQSLVLS